MRSMSTNGTTESGAHVATNRWEWRADSSEAAWLSVDGYSLTLERGCLKARFDFIFGEAKQVMMLLKQLHLLLAPHCDGICLHMREANVGSFEGQMLAYDLLLRGGPEPKDGKSVGLMRFLLPCICMPRGAHFDLTVSSEDQNRVVLIRALIGGLAGIYGWEHLLESELKVTTEQATSPTN